MSYTTIRIDREIKRRLERLKKKLGFESLSKTLEFAITVAEKASDRFSGNVNALLEAIKFAKDVGETDAEKIDEYLYGAENDGSN